MAVVPRSTPPQPRHGARAGTAAIEFALVVPALLVLVLGLVEFSRCVWTQSALQFAAEKAARCAAVNTVLCGTAADIQRYAASKMLAPGAAASNFTYAQSSCGKLVTANMTFSLSVPLVRSDGLTLTARSCHPA